MGINPALGNNSWFVEQTTQNYEENRKISKDT